MAFVGATAASAAKFTAGGAGEAISESTIEDHVFTITGATVECANAEFTGTTTGTEAATLEVSPKYTECAAFGFESGATVNTGTCDYVFGSATTGEYASMTLQGCEDGTTGIEIIVNLKPFAFCVVDIPHQTIVAGALLWLNPTSWIVRAIFGGSLIMVDVTKSEGFCPLTTGTHSGANGGEYEGGSDFTIAKGMQYDP